jgi:hypothetical protein
MTAEEKAKELIKKFTIIADDCNGMYEMTIATKEKALICVDEILNLIEGFDLELTYNYYKEVKNEINKL